MPDTATAPALDAVLARLDADLDPALERLFALLRCKSVSTDPAYAPECRRAAELLRDDLASMGFAARLWEGDGHPLVIGEIDGGPGPRLLFYGHYDVQPVDPLELWDRDPFDPAILTRGDGSRCLSGRGTSDDKGQLMTFLEACRAWLAVEGRLPCPVTVVLEGEEECHGTVLSTFLEREGKALGCDLAVVCDTTMWNAGTPAITTSLRGMVGEEITVRAASRDLHSGFYGNAAANPLTVLATALAGLRDASGWVTVPGFYDGVPEVPQAVRAQWDALGFDAGAFLGAVGLSKPYGEADRSALEQIWARPTFEINGMWGGYTGAGFKTVIPAEAHAKISFRLVFDQDPVAIREAVRAQLRAAIPEDCEIAFSPHGTTPATAMPVDSPAFEAARRALSEEWGVEAAFIGAGGSIPVVGDFRRVVGLDSLLIGFGLESDRIHSPNEQYELESYRKGARSWARVLPALAAAG